MGTKELNRRLDRTALDGEAEAKAEAESFEETERWLKKTEEYFEAQYGPAPPLTKAEQEELCRFFDSLDAVVEARKLGKPVPPPYQPSKVLTG